MAGNQNSGGYRPTAPQNNFAVSATGGAGNGGQPSRYIAGMPYGQGQELMQQQQGAPMLNVQAQQTTQPSAVAGLEPIVSLTAPTQRPSEDISTGMPFNPATPGTEVLNLPRERSLSEILASMIDLDPTGDTQELYNFVASRGL